MGSGERAGKRTSFKSAGARESRISEFTRDPDFLRGFASLFHFGAIKWDRRLIDIQERPQFEDVRVTVSAKRGGGR